jgi:iron(III) transport system ATP-binding protein
MTAVRAQGLVLRYPGASVDSLDGASFAVAPGSLTALLGPSGCGKTSVLRVLAGLALPDAGRVWLGGADMTDRAPQERPVSLVVQSGGLFPHLDVWQNVLFPLQAIGTPVAQAHARASEALALVGLADLARRRPASLSGGEHKRVALARAIAQQAAVLLLDEPLSSVEPRLRHALRDQIRALQQRLGLTVIYVTHDQREALAVSDQVVLMEQGRVVQAGTPQELYQRPVNAFAASFMGEASVLLGQRGPGGDVCLQGLQLPGRHPGPPGEVQVAVRPETWRLLHCGRPGLAGSILKRRYLGKAMEYHVRTPLGPVLVHAAAGPAPWEEGAPVSLQVEGPGAWVLGS